MNRTDFDAVVVGAGPNGLAAAISLQQAGQRVLLLEGKSTIGGGLRTAELTLPGFHHDICSAIHPLAVSSPFFSRLPLEQFGIEFIYPSIAAAHPFDDGTAAILSPSLEQTAAALGKDEQAYMNLLRPLVNNWPDLINDILGPFGIPRHPLKLVAFGMKALAPAVTVAKRFQTRAARGLWAGMAAHSMMPLTNATTAAAALVLMAAGHYKGWPLAKGGSQSIANALGAYFQSLGGIIETNRPVWSLDQLPSWKALLLDVTPRQLMQIAGYRFSSIYKWQLSRYRYGMGVFKIDWALDGPIPFKATACREAGTVHIGNTLEEIALSERQVMDGFHPEKPYVLLAQQSLFDHSRAPGGKQTAWAYCHVPNGSRKDLTEIIEQQVERFAPGFRDRILARHVMNSEDMERYNPNYVGGDISGGILDIGQLFTRPALRASPYRTSAKGIYICSSSTPPGGGVHGMCGFHAAQRALKDVLT
ncbi:phytoene desaturase family protein [Pseudobacter ginsenosidimutans]|uniref:Phytoene dehydrogenase-like protein n=1 Tax=Pseudobacter ginsenosidimutans TaxID=661488 RepID=A0A4Q7MUV9_9BACT|nr:NAD(P)/FAD-dependent oxidoreductase [Pseudobacter ginsenosidimutans]QEC40591.1 NAD(P)/FAD-dependent oxidoreductase [Pseudobacter ginsenosidimutans]RZS72692.1 phytoene dehydrogenase-like protein [Pseudobacter ginsenosidimutans]